jgi:hypothetical protein
MITPPVSVGFSFPVHPKHLTKPCHNLGGYTVVEDHEVGILIIGYREFNLFEHGVGEVKIIPIDTNHIPTVALDSIEESDRGTSIFWTFDYEPDQIVYFVTFADGTWVFNSAQDAFSMMALIVDVKRHGLQEHINETLKCDTESTE